MGSKTSKICLKTSCTWHSLVTKTIPFSSLKSGTKSAENGFTSRIMQRLQRSASTNSWRSTWLSTMTLSKSEDFITSTHASTWTFVRLGRIICPQQSPILGENCLWNSPSKMRSTICLKGRTNVTLSITFASFLKKYPSNSKKFWRHTKTTSLACLIELTLRIDYKI